MSRTPTATETTLRELVESLISAGRDVVDNWETRSLAATVYTLETEIEAATGTLFVLDGQEKDE